MLSMSVSTTLAYPRPIIFFGPTISFIWILFDGLYYAHKNDFHSILFASVGLLYSMTYIHVQRCNNKKRIDCTSSWIVYPLMDREWDTKTKRTDAHTVHHAMPPRFQ